VATTNLVWIVNAYVLTFASLILLGGRLGDRFGRRRFFALGLVIFTGFSLACALATSERELIAFRAAQGVGAALLAPLALSIIVDAYPPERRTFAVGLWAAVAGIGFAAGGVVGGLLLAVLPWPAIFWLNVPVGIVGLLLTAAFVRESRDPQARHLDVAGAFLVSAALVVLTVGLVETDVRRWLSLFTLSSLGAAALLLVAFVLHEKRTAEPMFPLAFFRRRVFTAANVVYLLMYASTAGMLFFMTLYLQNVLDYSALETGLAFLFLSVPFLLVAVFGGRVRQKMRSDRLIGVGKLLAAAGTSWLALLGQTSGLAPIAAAFTLTGAGFGLAVPALSAAAVGAIETEHAGVASGVLNSSRQVGAALGLAIVATASAFAATRAWDDYVATLPASVQTEARGFTGAVTGADSEAVAAKLGDQAGAQASDAFVSGFRTAMIVAGAMVLAGFLVVVFALGAKKVDAEAIVPSSEQR
jgi:EmrB/QacA subfamily drug resistance transporter